MNRKSIQSLPQSRRLLLLARLAAVVLLLALPAAQAGELGAKHFTLRGFGTLGATTQNTDGIEFRRNMGQPHGVAGGDVELYSDSLAGVQVDAKVSSTLGVMAQAVSRLRADGTYTLKLTQGFVRYSPDDSMVMRAGRIGYDIYLLAESRQVGYSYLALRPPPEFYGLISNDEIDGGDIAYTRRVGRGLARVRLFGGGAPGETAFQDGTYDETDANVYGATFDYLYRGWTARIAMIHFEYDPDSRLAALAAGLRMTGVPESVDIAHEIDQPKLKSLGIQLGVAYDDGPMQAQLLYGIGESTSIAGPDFRNLYTLFGYRLRQFTPFVSFASSRNCDPHSTGLPALPMFAPLNDAVAGLQANFRTEQQTTSFGVRYDFSSHIDLKLQVDLVSVRDSVLMFDRRTPPGGPADFTVAAVAIDFVF